MKVGEIIHLFMNDSQTGYEISLRCNIIGIDEQYLYIDHPVNEKTLKTEYLPKNTHLQGFYVAEDKVPLHFPTKVIKRVDMGIPGYAIELPQDDDVKRIQRRAHLRVQTAIDVAVHSPENRFEPFTTVSHDLSGGGVSLILPHGFKLGSDVPLELWLILPMETYGYKYIKLLGETVRESLIEEQARKVSVRFKNIKVSDQDNIIRYCFNEQRNLRLKEVK